MHTDGPRSETSDDSTNGCIERLADGEVDAWIAVIRELYPEEADLAGGIAPATITQHVERERHHATIHRNLEADDRVVQTTGVHRDERGGGPRLSYVPAEEADR